MANNKYVRVVDTRGYPHNILEAQATPQFLKKYGLKIQELPKENPEVKAPVEKTPPPARPANTEGFSTDAPDLLSGTTTTNTASESIPPVSVPPANEPKTTAPTKTAAPRKPRGPNKAKK